ncbi:hypothetical protein RclHR1_15940001 [Rhizophagus clarus]|uniref:Reverse transcriptase domain-containing protein n=1 Tax=Rhizophagus clarus TaxID=94130 RepID=A0A2Z6QKI0_9GLOM|nr:hypothetical protein RclHR1_15940001 [Rhizophagus clarus]
MPIIVEVMDKNREELILRNDILGKKDSVIDFENKETVPAIFQRLMDEILNDYIRKFVTVYLNDIMIYLKNFKEHIRYIEKVLERIEKVNMIIKLKKCKFGRRNIEFLGHKVEKDGLKANEKKIETIRDISIPRNITEVRSFLELYSYYRRFIKNFTRIARPLTDLTSKKIDFKWTEKQQEAFESLKKRLMEKPILEHPDFEKEFILITDASGEGLGFILAQKNKDDKEAVIAYRSKSLSHQEIL